MFYGWWVTFACFLLHTASAPAHSFGINSFVEYFIAELDINRTGVSFVWLAASWVSAALVPFAGAALDQFGARAMCAAITPLYILTFISLALTRSQVQLTISAAALRFLGADCLPLIASTTVQRWFVRLVGRASALAGLAGAIVIAMPTLMGPLIAVCGWRWAYAVLAIVIGCILSAVICLLRDWPSAVGLQPDGDDKVPFTPCVELERAAVESPLTEGGLRAAEAHRASDSRADKVHPERIRLPGSPARSNFAPLEATSLRQAAGHPLFWCLAAQNLFFDLFWAGLNYHFWDFATGLMSGGATAVALSRAYYLPLSLSLNAAEISTGLFVTDRLSVRGRVLLLGVLNTTCALVASCSVRAHSELALCLFGVAYGAGTGAREALKNVCLGSLFGTHALGRIQGLHQGFTVASTGMGPVLWALSRECAGGYGPVVVGSCVALGLAGCVTGMVATFMLRAKALGERIARDDDE